MKRPHLPLEVLSYYLTTFAVGAAGVIIVFEEHHPARWAVLALALTFGLLSLSVFTPYATARRGRVRALLGVQTAIIVALLALVPKASFFIVWFYMMSVYAILALPRREAHAWLGGFTLLSLLLLIAHQGLVGGLVSAMIYASGFAFFTIFAHLTYRAQQARAESERLLTELQAAHRQLQDYAARAEALAAAEERNRLAREMHDTLGHRLTVAAVQLEAAERLIPTQPARAAGMVATAREQVRAALADLRRTVAALRQPLESDLPLETAVRRLAAEFQQATGIAVHVAWPDETPPLSPAQRLTLYRGVQEGLTNIHKHAAATQAWVTLETTAGRITLRVRDDGSGPREARGGFGLRGLQERAAHLGGQARFGPAPEGGSLLEITLPQKG